MPLEQMVNECQATTLSSQTAFTDAGKVGILVETFTLEDGHHTLVLHPAICHYGIQNNLPVGIHVLQILPGDALEELRYGEEGTAGQPSAHIVVCDMVKQTAGGDRHDVVLQILQVSYSDDLLHGVGIAEDKVTKAKVLQYQSPQVHIHLLGILVDEMCLALPGQLLLVTLGRFHYQGDIRIILPDDLQEVISSLLVLLSSWQQREAAVADDP